MKYSITRNTLQPLRGHQTDAGIDIYIPQFTEKFIKDFKQLNPQGGYFLNQDYGEILLFAGKRIKMPTGIHFNIPKNNILMVLQKTSIPNKTGVISGARVIDEDYQGEFIASLINTSPTENAILKQHQKFIQLVLIPINQDRKLQLVDFDNLYDEETKRGAGAYGSTGI